MGYKKKQAAITCSSNEDDNSGNISIGMPPNILMKVSWSKHLKFLTVEDKAAVFTNIFNYYTGDDLVEMNPVAEMFFATATELFDYNINKYEETVKLNRIKGKKGGRPPKETRNNPTGLLENPKNLKEKVKDKAKEIVKEKEIVIDSSSLKQYQNKIRKIIEIDFRTLPDQESKFFCYDVIELVEKLGWSRFDLIIFGTPVKDIPSVLSAYNLIELEQQVKSTRRNYSYFIDKLIE
jgi:hypothetical protein